MTALTFEVDLPPRALGPNGSHGHWSRVAKARAAYRDAVRWVALDADQRGQFRGAEIGRRRVSLVFGIRGGRARGLYQPRDEPNAVAAFKAGFDGLTDARVISDDSKRWMELGPVRIDAKRGPFVQVTVEAIE